MYKRQEGEIGDELTYFTKLIFKWNAEDDGIPQEERKPIKIFLHTPGGQLDVALGLCDAILTSKTPVWTINAGWAMSSGTLILVCGQKRFCMKNSAALIHSTSGGSVSYTHLDVYKRQIEDIEKAMTFRLSKGENE